MRLIKEVRDLDAVGKQIQKSKEDYKTRITSRAIVLDSDNNIAIIFLSKLNYSKLPGGGLEEKEDVLEALSREIKEEVGCNIEVIKEIGEIIEYRNKYNLKQISYCFLAKVKGKKQEPKFIQKEKRQGCTLIWVPINKAIKLLENNKSEDYTAKFIILRDYIFLLEAKKILER